MEEGELTILVKEVGGSSRFEKIVKMIEDSEKLKSGAESKAEHLADKLVPYSLGGTDFNLSAHKKCDKGTVRSDGGLQLCLKTCNADLCSYLRSVRQVFTMSQ